jgi:hypothetical protein
MKYLNSVIIEGETCEILPGKGLISCRISNQDVERMWIVCSGELADKVAKSIKVGDVIKVVGKLEGLNDTVMLRAEHVEKGKKTTQEARSTAQEARSAAQEK